MPISAQTSGRISKAIKGLHALSKEWADLPEADFQRKMKTLKKQTISIFNACPLCRKKTLHTFTHGRFKGLCAKCFNELDMTDSMPE